MAGGNESTFYNTRGSSTNDLDQGTSTMTLASSSTLPEEEENEVIEITSDDDEVDDNCPTEIGFVNENPYFVSRAKKFEPLYVPRKFMNEHGTKLGEDIMIHDPLGRITKVNLFKYKGGRTVLRGWHAVYKLNSMCDGDKFVCELVQGNIMKLHLNLHNVLNQIKPIPLKDYSYDQEDVKPTIHVHASSSALQGVGMDAPEHVIKKHKGNSFDLLTPHGSSVMAKEQKSQELDVGISPISPNALAISYEDGLVNINGYKVRETTAPVLKAVFAKYGDITANCSCKTLSVKASLLEVLCNTIHFLRFSDIETVLSNLEIIEHEVLDLKHLNIDVAWLYEDLERFRKVSACCDKSLQLKEEVQQRGIELSSLTEEVEQQEAELAKIYRRFEEIKKRETDMKLLIKNMEENLMRLEAEKALLIQGLFNKLP